MLTNWDALEASSDMPTEEAILNFRRPGEEEAVEPTTSSGVYLPIRRIFDFTLALALSMIALPIVILAALAVRLT